MSGNRIMCPDCKKERIVRGHEKKDRRCKSCYTERQKINPNKDSTYKVLRTSVQHGAKRRCYEYNLSFEQYKEIVTKSCYWCGVEPPLKNPKAQRMPTLPAPAHGIDRIDNSVGYTYNNCVASCQTCNVAKNNSSAKDFLAWIQKVYVHQFKR